MWATPPWQLQLIWSYQAYNWISFPLLEGKIKFFFICLQPRSHHKQNCVSFPTMVTTFAFKNHSIFFVPNTPYKCTPCNIPPMTLLPNRTLVKIFCTRSWQCHVIPKSLYHHSAKHSIRGRGAHFFRHFQHKFYNITLKSWQLKYFFY